MPKRSDQPKWVQEARPLREQGASWADLSERLRLPVSSLRYHLDPKRREAERERARRTHAANREAILARQEQRRRSRGMEPQRYGRQPEVRGRCTRCGQAMGVGGRADGLCARCRHDGRVDRAEVIVTRWQEGATGPEIAAELGVTSAVVYADIRALRFAGWNLERRNPPGVGRQAELSTQAVAAVCERWRRGQTARQIADAMDLDRHAVNRLVARLRLEGRKLPYRRPKQTAPRAREGVEPGQLAG